MLWPMKAITVEPMKRGSLRLEEIPEPDLRDGTVLVEGIAVGVCGTDVEIAEGKYGWAPEGRTRLVLGHESLGRVIDPGPAASLERGDLVVGIVRRPDPVPCPCCAAGEWDMCRNGRYTERGIKQRDGYGSELFRVEPEFLIKLDPSLGLNGVLVEPTSIVAKAWDHTERIGRRSRVWAPKTLLVTGAGPIGLLAAMIGVQRELDVHVLDHNDRGPKRQIVHELGATFHVGELADMAIMQPDILMECTGVPDVVRDTLGHTAAAGVVCLLGVSAPGQDFDLDIGGLNRTMVLDN